MQKFSSDEDRRTFKILKFPQDWNGTKMVPDNLNFLHVEDKGFTY